MNPTEPADSDVSKRGVVGDIIMALRFFSRLPTGASAHIVPELAVIAPVLPLASVVIGLGPALVLLGAAFVGFPSYFAATLAVAAMVIVSGAMGEDALADAADGLFGGQTVDRRLEIMKDSRHGTYGVAALVVFIALRVTALGAVVGSDPVAAAGIWLVAGIAGRSGSLWLAVALPAARMSGAAASVGRLKMRPFAIGAAIAAVLLMVLGGLVSSPVGAGLALLLAGVLVIGWTALCRRLVGGQTGDLIGALGALIEITVLGTLLVFV